MGVCAFGEAARAACSPAAAILGARAGLCITTDAYEAPAALPAQSEHKWYPVDCRILEGVVR